MDEKKGLTKLTVVRVSIERLIGIPIGLGRKTRSYTSDNRTSVSRLTHNFLRNFQRSLAAPYFQRKAVTSCFQRKAVNND